MRPAAAAGRGLLLRCGCPAGRGTRPATARAEHVCARLLLRGFPLIQDPAQPPQGRGGALFQQLMCATWCVCRTQSCSSTITPSTICPRESSSRCFHTSSALATRPLSRRLRAACVRAHEPSTHLAPALKPLTQTVPSQDRCMRLGFDEWQGESFYFKCSCKKCKSLECTGGECQDCGKYVGACVCGARQLRWQRC